MLTLQWMQREIRKFGGDPNRVTPWGYSSSSGLISLLSLSPKTEGLFSQMILMSGSSRGIFRFKDDVTIYFQVAEKVGCSAAVNQEPYHCSENFSSVINCMQKCDVNKLLEVYDSLRNYNFYTRGNIHSKFNNTIYI